MNARKIDFYIESSSNLRGLKAQIEGLRTIQKIYGSIVPDGLGKFSAVSRLETGTVTLTANNGAIAAKLKQFTPKLLDRFRKQGVEVTSIRIEVQVGKRGQKQPLIAPKQKQLNQKTLLTLNELSAKLEPGALKNALSNMINRHVSDSADDESEDDGQRAHNKAND